MVLKVKSRTILHPLTFTRPLMSLFVTCPNVCPNLPSSQPILINIIASSILSSMTSKSESNTHRDIEWKTQIRGGRLAGTWRLISRGYDQRR